MENRSRATDQRQLEKGEALRKLTIVTSIAIAMVLARAPTARADGADVYGVGGGWITAGGGPREVHFALSAHTGPQGDFGQVVAHTADGLAPLEATVDIDCVHVVATIPPGAWVSGVVTKVSPQPNAFGIVLGEEVGINVADGGDPSAGIVDTWVPSFPFPAPPFCKALTPFSAPDVTDGNIVVKP